MTTSTRPLARHRSAASNPTMTALTASVATGARRYRRRSAVIAASSGLVVTMGLPAAAVAAPHTDEAEGATASVPAVPAAPVESTTAVIDVAPTAEVDLAMGETASVDSAEAERREAAAAAAAARAEADRVAARQAARASAAAAAVASRTTAPQVSRSAARSSSGASAARSTAGATAAAVVAPPAAASSAGGAVAIAQRYTGTPYVFGGSGPSGFDCSGLVQYVYRQMGVSLPRTASAQAASGRRVSAGEARPGDLVSFTGSGGVYHIGIYAGNGMMVDSPRPGKSVALRSIWSSSVSFTRVG